MENSTRSASDVIYRARLLVLVVLVIVMGGVRIGLTTTGDLDKDTIPDSVEDINGNGNQDDDDSDGDGLPDYIDPDDDNDNIPTAIELTDDPDGDQVPNYLDSDSDGDTVADIFEGQADDDCDTVPNYIDANDSDGDCGDSDGDGIANSIEMTICSDPNDRDSDNDSVPDGEEYGTGTIARDTDGDGIPDLCDRDDDGDGLLTRAERDQCNHGFMIRLQPVPGLPQPGTCRPLLMEIDTDQDGQPDYLDTNSDGDVLDDENLGDADNDGIPNAYDSIDFDGPDADPDMDGFSNSAEAALGTSGTNADSDFDGIPDNFEIPDPENPADHDQDGIIDALDPDDDNDGLLTKDEGFGDFDQDGIPSHLDCNSDGDEFYDICEGGLFLDVDGDGTANYQDFNDADGPAAGGFNSHAGSGDRDCDGIIDHNDPNDQDGPCFIWGPHAITPRPADDCSYCPKSPYAAVEEESEPQARRLIQPQFTRQLKVRYGEVTFPLTGVVPPPRKVCGQKCRKQIADVLKQKIGRSSVTCQKRRFVDGTGMSCAVGGKDLSAWLIGNGLARASRDAPESLQKAQREAQRQNLGVWRRR